MPDTKLFRRQHKRILQKATELSHVLKAEKLADDALEARLLVAELAGLINVHLAMEDEGLYPQLVASQRADVREIAKQYIEEMGGIGVAFRDYTDSWTHTNAAQEDPHRFIEVTHDILKKLSDRIRREDTELYPLVDKE